MYTAMYWYFLLACACVLVSVTSPYNCDYPVIYDITIQDDYTEFEDPAIPSSNIPLSTNQPSGITHHHQSTRIPAIISVESPSTTPPRPTPPQPTSSRPTPPRINSGSTDAPPSVITRLGEDVNSLQQTQSRELQCLEVLDRLVAAEMQEDIDKVSVNDLGRFSTLIKVPPFSSYYSNPESEWIQEGGMALEKLDKCVRNMVSKTVPRMDQDEIQCLNKMYTDYLTRETRAVRFTEKYISETSREQLPFKSFYTYFEMTELLFDNKNIDALDAELRAIHEDMLEFYIKAEEDKSKKIFIVEQECEWKNARLLREARSEEDRYRRFAQLVKTLVNRYLVAEILQKWVPGVIIPQSRYSLWSQARSAMEQEILDKVKDLQRQKRDAQFLCTHAAELATKFFTDQKTILFQNMKNTSLSLELKTHDKYSYVVALAGVLEGKSDNRLARVKILVNEFKESYYCLTNFVRMIENHQRYMTASALVNEMLPYGNTYCLIKEMSPELVNPRYCRCQGTFCEQFGLATVRAQRYQLNQLPDGTYTVTTNSSYRILPLDELINSANQRIAQQKFNTWWYRHQKMPA